MRLYDLIQNNKKLTFIDPFTDRSYGVADFHHSLVIDDRQALVFIYADNLIGSIEVFLNFLGSRFTVSLLSPQLSPVYKQELEEVYQPYYIYDPSRTEIPGFDIHEASSRIRLFQHQLKPDYPIHPDIKLLLSTSGTTGSPKFVKLSEENLIHNAEAILEFLPIREDDITPLNVPVIFVYGLSIFTTNALKAGTIICTNRDVLQKEFWDDFVKYQFSSLGGVPYVYEMLQRIDFFKKEYPFLRYMTQTGGILNQTLAKVIEEYVAPRGQQFFVMYGQTEAAGRMAYLSPADLKTKNTSIGRPIRNGSFQIDPSTRELLYSGPNVFGGYATKSADLNTFQPGDVLYTGDIAEKDEEGYYYIIGRIKRIVKLLGTRFNLDEIELIIKNAFNGETFACIGVEDKHLLVIHLNQDLKDEEIKQFLKTKLNLHPSIIKIKQVSKIPLTPNGKVDYTSARSLYQQV
ncbi:AMP-binding protein [Pedobacter cryoconitis]|uniref:Acyl-CoA synthetase (AMP-forming)/AMP-acid ligase II n=1 Tax=Pedobacter cryoconitis TaxID=188932 RepID=A0A7X0J6A8_9SPHI|nr:AMP-binding protein [Pedobacter cryoconitis]MBB6501698.1 acyl-CoA synthetase (AMP-forming)/AMP-acid ligase II [Pedobacter cryoconitis]